MSVNSSADLQPPHPQDVGLVDYTRNIQKIFQGLEVLSHDHTGRNGVLTSFPSASQGDPGDILVAVVNGTAYLCFKTTKTDWFKIAGTHI